MGSLTNYHGFWKVRTEEGIKGRFECPYLGVKNCSHPDNPETGGLFGHENCVYSRCPIHVAESFEKLSDGRKG